MDQRRLVVVAVAGAAAAVAVGVFAVQHFPSGLDSTSVEREVAVEYEQRTGDAVEVRCPEDMPKASGEVYACDGTRTDDGVIYIEIQIADPGSDPDYRWWTPPA